MPRISDLPSYVLLTGDELMPLDSAESDIETWNARVADIAALAVAHSGVATLTAGTVVVSEVSITADTLVFLTAQDGGVSTGSLRVSARTPGVGFTILSTQAGDTCDVAWLLVEPPVS